MLIRPAEPDDWASIWPIYRHVVSAGETIAYPDPPEFEVGRAIWMETPPGLTVTAVLDGEVVGSAKLGPNRPGRGSHIATGSFIVDPARRGTGIGRALGNHAIDWATDAGYSAIQFNAVVAVNRAAVRLWKSLGFEVVGTVPEAFDHRHEGLVDLLIMYRRLTASDVIGG